jgi:hypothetical protein
VTINQKPAPSSSAWRRSARVRAWRSEPTAEQKLCADRCSCVLKIELIFVG